MTKKTPVCALEIPLRTISSVYPEPFASRMQGREKRLLGNFFDLTNFGVNLTHLKPGAMSSLLHAHETQDEFVYILEGVATLRVDDEEFEMKAGGCMGFKAGTGVAHQLLNLSNEMVTYLEVGDRSPNDSVEYPDDDIQAKISSDGSWVFTHKDGSPYE